MLGRSADGARMGDESHRTEGRLLRGRTLEAHHTPSSLFALAIE
jgi:hypothetical protein